MYLIHFCRRTIFMIKKCSREDFQTIYEIINDAATAYNGVIPEDCYHESYMSKEELRGEITGGVNFYGFEEDGKLIGIMGIQNILDVTLIRHAYVVTEERNKGIGSELLSFLKTKTEKPVLVGPLAYANWAIKFYQSHRFKLFSTEEKDNLPKKYWNIPYRQIEISMILIDSKYLEQKTSNISLTQST
jgi:N-acetylglutamate synthase-like GNAT family acetyltransferase